MEAYHNGVEDYLIDSLSFKLPPGSSYVVDRKNLVSGQLGLTYISLQVELK